ncbi:TfuA-like protein [Streptomyces griseofuscus]|uniref:TfuA-like protein n=1 Tax=Streptomyces griseofuscus TaxID=146922 RepID=UPI003456B6E2
MTVHIFAGPTLGHDEVRRHLPDAVVHPPIRHGDLLRLRLGTGDIVLIIDGLFHQQPPVRHKEILDAMADGAIVVGASSMGALRAAEMHQYGMIGIGRIFEMYRDEVIDADDEVAVVHTPPPDWRMVSEALVNIRHGAAVCADRGIISAADAERLVEVARAMPYPERQWQSIELTAGRLDPALGLAADAVRQLLASEPEVGDLKRADALLALDVVGTGFLTPSPDAEHSWWTDARWRTMHLARWTAQFRSPGEEAPFGSGLAVFHYQQIYDPDFPRRWERHVLRRIVISAPVPPPAGLPLAAQALVVATRDELGLELLAENLQQFWLTKEERAVLNDEQRMLRILVRSSCKSLDFTTVPYDEDGLLTDVPGTRKAVAEALGINRGVEEISPTRHIDSLRSDRVAAHLAATWELAPGAGEYSLEAAARDRGFTSLDGVIRAARPFYLRNAAHTAPLGAMILQREGGSPAHV